MIEGLRRSGAALLSFLSMLASFAGGVGCGAATSDDAAASSEAMSFARSAWSAPVNLGATINTAANEANPTLSPDGRSLYFVSNRPEGEGGNDIWVSRRATPDDPWETPVNLGPVINTPAVEAAPGLTIDGHWLFFASDRPGGNGLNDIWVSRRDDPNDDLGWGPPVHLGPEVNTDAFETGPEFLRSAEDGATSLYFVRQPVGGLFQIWTAPVNTRGEVSGPAAPVSELWSAGGSVGPTVRTDGREIFFFSGAPRGGLGSSDLWTSTRRSVHEPWEAPRNLGAPMNSEAFDQQPSLSDDGRILVFVSNRVEGGFGGLDLWMSTRTPSGRE